MVRRIVRIALISLMAVLFTGIRGMSQEVRIWKLNGVDRQALIFKPAGSSFSNGALPPVVFAFHGHGGNMRQASRSFAYQDEWPQAVVVYMQGLPTPGALTDPAGLKNGWQARKGDELDRDLKFFDTVLNSLTVEKSIDPARIFVTGHSNGGGFTYLLWANRAPKIRAFAPVSAIGNKEFAAASSVPKPVIHIMGYADPLVRPRWQEITIGVDVQINGVAKSGCSWENAGDIKTTLYRSDKSTPVVVGVHPGGHVFPRGASTLIVKFFQMVDMKTGQISGSL